MDLSSEDLINKVDTFIKKVFPTYNLSHNITKE